MIPKGPHKPFNRKDAIAIAIVTAIVLAAILVAWSVQAHAGDIVRPQCQTQETKTMRAVADAEAESLRERVSTGGWIIQMNGHYDQGSAAEDGVRTALKGESRLNLLKARALESVKCPHLAAAILGNLPATPIEQAKVDKDFDKRQQIRREFEVRMDQWRADHPGCKHVQAVRRIGPNGKPTDQYWQWNDGTPITYEAADLSGKANGVCRAGEGHTPLGNTLMLPDGEVLGQGSEDHPKIPADYADQDCRAALGDYWFGDQQLPNQPGKEACSQ